MLVHEMHTSWLEKRFARCGFGITNTSCILRCEHVHVYSLQHVPAAHIVHMHVFMRILAHMSHIRLAILSLAPSSRAMANNPYPHLLARRSMSDNRCHDGRLSSAIWGRVRHCGNYDEISQIAICAHACLSTIPYSTCTDVARPCSDHRTKHQTCIEFLAASTVE